MEGLPDAFSLQHHSYFAVIFKVNSGQCFPMDSFVINGFGIHFSHAVNKMARLEHKVVPVR